ncbi:MAG: N-acetylmuramoyl-L-alanine amidase [Ferruginibacter sp.]|nr:N-acetylmuramoyl-L-alanine amidase [Ferruginibacter sp.]
MRSYALLFIAGTLILASCAPKPYAATNKMYKSKAGNFAKMINATPKDSVIADSLKIPPYWVGTTNFGMRKPNMVIIHHTAQNSCEQTLKTFTLERTQVSAHYVICEDGTLHHMLNDYLRAWHAGNSKWGGVTDINSSSIGIEIDNDGFEKFSEAQLNTLMGLLATLKKDYGIPAANFIGHGDIAPSRKNDPNVNFPWKRFADSGYGVWYADTTGVVVPADFNSTLALRIVGYDVSKLAAATQAFRRHFLSIDKPGELTEPEKKVLYLLMQKYL